jgi:hypothetical protein
MQLPAGRQHQSWYGRDLCFNDHHNAMLLSESDDDHDDGGAHNDHDGGAHNDHDDHLQSEFPLRLYMF